ncbi:MAG: metal-dependent transcriptional regulator [Methanomicrobiales archaeon]|nr:metal-dependent transcriptional regulator [Methanomicrobiales archaeon]
MRRKTAEEYIEAIFRIQLNEGGKASTGMIAATLGVSPPSITEMLKKLEREGLVFYEPHAGVRLSQKGQRIAERLSMRHALLASFFQSIGVSPERAERDACQIEHHISEETIARIDEFMQKCRDEKKGEPFV